MRLSEQRLFVNDSASQLASKPEMPLKLQQLGCYLIFR